MEKIKAYLQVVGKPFVLIKNGSLSQIVVKTIILGADADKMDCTKVEAEITLHNSELKAF